MGSNADRIRRILSDGAAAPPPEAEPKLRQVERDAGPAPRHEVEPVRLDDDLRARYRGIAERRVRLALLLSEVGRENNIRVTEDEMTRAVAEQARMFQGREAEIYEFYQSNPEAMQSLQAPIFEDKVVDFIVEMAQVTDRAVGIDELAAEPEDGADAAE